MERTHNCAARLVQSVPVSESFSGKTVWEGVVHIFALTGHPTAKKAYAWSSPIEGSDSHLQAPKIKIGHYPVVLALVRRWFLR